jgi:transposase
VGRKSYRPWTPRQSYLLPPSPAEWLPKDHLVYFVLDVVEKLDLTEIERAIAKKDSRGERPYAPRMMVALLIYGYARGIFSSRKLARATYEDVAFVVLGGGAHPHFTSINQFRLDYREAFARLFTHVVRLCRRAGLVTLGHIAIDGTKILANASKHKAMSYDRMQEDDARIRGEINELLAQADAADRSEDECYGAGNAPEDLPEELSRRETRLARIDQAMKELEREAAQSRAEELVANAQAQWAKAEDPAVDADERGRAANRAARSEALAAELDPPDDDDGPPATGGVVDDLPRHRIPTRPDGTPDGDAQRNFTDPDSRVMVAGGAYVQAYNAQVVVDAKAQVIVAQAVTNQPPDVQHLAPMIERIQRVLGGTRRPKQLSADSGYFSERNVAACHANGIDPYIAVARTAHPGTLERRPPKLTPTQAAMKAKLESPSGRAVYTRRKVIAEPPIGQIKSALGFRRFSLRGLSKVRCEWALVCLAHNLLKLFRYARPNFMLARAT